MTKGKVMARKKLDKGTLNLQLPNELINHIREIADKQKRPFSSQIELFIEKGLESFDDQGNLIQKEK